MAYRIETTDEFGKVRLLPQRYEGDDARERARGQVRFMMYEAPEATRAIVFVGGTYRNLRSARVVPHQSQEV